MFKKTVKLYLITTFLIFALSCAVYANESTTTYGTAYKDLSPRTEIYAVTADPGSSYPYYNAKWELTNGVFYGRTVTGGSLPTGGYGVINGAAMTDESAVSFYYSLTDPYSLAYWSYLYGGTIADGKRGFLVHLNFENMGVDCANVVKGTYDSKLIETFRYLSTLKCPVFMRIGGEMNVWGDGTTANSYIAAYRHIAQLGRSYGNNVALIFSPNYSSGYLIDMDSYYPGDGYVDWVGTSLYYNRYANNGDTVRDAFYGVNAYGDAMLNIQQTVNLASLHRKPVIITENGSAWKQHNQNTTAFAADKVEKAYSFLTMVYPEIKGILYSDTSFGSAGTNFSLTENTVMTAAYNKAVKSNPTLLKTASGKASYYTRLSEYETAWSGKVSLAAYSYASTKLTASWYIDNELKATATEYPYSFEVDTNQISERNHKLTVRFSDGQEKSYGFSSTQYHTATVFRDVPGGKYYTEPVVWAVNADITSGTSKNTFSPQSDCTRGETVTFLWRAMGRPEPSVSASPFRDVQNPGAFYYKAVLYAVEQGITQGTSATTFSPDDTVNRAQFVTFLWRASGKPAATINNKFTDISADKYYYNAVLWAVENNITYGTADTLFSPGEPCKRCQVVTFLYRFKH